MVRRWTRESQPACSGLNSQPSAKLTTLGKLFTHVLLLSVSKVDAGQKAMIPDDCEGNQPQVWRPTGHALQTLWLLLLFLSISVFIIIIIIIINRFV